MEHAIPMPGVAELQGLYGPLKILEGKVQQIWALQEIQHGDWRTTAGTRLAVRQPGVWNRGSGPDFRDAVVELNGEARIGDVEIHLYREDWWRHGHHLDPAYDSVMLHVVLFAGGMESPVRTAGGRLPDEWVMGCWLREDVESVAGGEPGLFGELAPELREWLESDEPESVRNRLKTGADRRWLGKEAMARCLYRSHAWEGTLHRLMLFYLGFPCNRRPFYAMAERFPPGNWADERLVDRLRKEFEKPVRWNLGRPANRAEKRLRQYVAVNQVRPDWMSRAAHPPQRLVDKLALPAGAACERGATKEYRKVLAMREWQRWLVESVFGNAVSRSLAARLWIDVLIPVMSAAGVLPREGAGALWFHAPAAVYPDAYVHLLKHAGLHSGAGYPVCNGWMQGLIWADDQLRLERIRSAMPARSPSPKHGLTS